MYLFNSTEWCYIKRTTDNISQILLQASRWRVKTANTILQIPWKKVKSHENTPTWSKNSANSQCKAWICKQISRLLINQNPATYIRFNYIENENNWFACDDLRFSLEKPWFCYVLNNENKL
jgi:hypothetical protein